MSDAVVLVIIAAEVVVARWMLSVTVPKPAGEARDE
jgi:hypothetical protein